MATPGVLFLFAILFAIARTGTPIQCEVSHNIRTTLRRSSSLQTCAPEFDACALFVVEATRGGRTVKTVKKSCAKRENCDSGPVLMHLENGLREIGESVCCTTDGCNAAIPAVRTWDETPNGLWCPSCSTTYPNSCQQEIMRCQGQTNMCFLKIADPIVQMGCATRSFCTETPEFGLTITDSLGVVLGGQRVACIDAYNG